MNVGNPESLVPDDVKITIKFWRKFVGIILIAPEWEDPDEDCMQQYGRTLEEREYNGEAEEEEVEGGRSLCV